MATTAHLYDTTASTYELAWHVPASLPLLSLFTRLLPQYTSAHHRPHSHHHHHHSPTHILELACGTGFLLRRARTLLHPHYLCGVDISSAMIHEALRLEETQQPLGSAPIDFIVADCAGPGRIEQLDGKEGSFHVVMGNFLFNYAKDEGEMGRMWRNVSRYLRGGGVFVGTTQVFEAVPASVREGRYGMKVSVLEELGEGKGRCVRQKLEFGWEHEVGFESFMMLEKEVWERTARQAGMVDLRFHAFKREDVPVEVKTPEGVKGREEKYWDELLEHPFNLVMTARLSSKGR